MEGYKSFVKRSSKELSPKEKVAIKDTSNCVKLDEACNTGSVRIAVDYYAEIEIHNPKSTERPTYSVYVIVDKSGSKFVTGSPSFISAFEDIFTELADCGEEWEIECYKLDSKNYKGKQFLTCSVI